MTTKGRGFKFQEDLKRTQSTHTDDVKRNRATDIRRDNDIVKTPSVDLHDIDYSIQYQVQNIMKPRVDEAGISIEVPIMYASPEKWASIQKQGFMRDIKGKIMTPVIAFKRNSITKRDDIPNNKYSDDASTMLARRKYTLKNRYDQFSVLVGQKPIQEYYQISVPDYFTVEYEVIIWCNYVAQVNHITEQFAFWEGRAWGETYKFPATISDFTFETVNDVGEDRVTKATANLTLQAYLLPKDDGSAETIRKIFSPKKIVIEEVVDTVPVNRNEIVIDFEIGLFDNSFDNTFE